MDYLEQYENEQKAQAAILLKLWDSINETKISLRGE